MKQPGNKLKTGIFFAGNYLSSSTGITSVCEELSEKFKENNWVVVKASSQLNRFFRMVDFLWTAWHSRGQYHVAVIEVYSGLAFHWANLLNKFLRILKKPSIITLHGGKLPEFSQRKPKQITKLLCSASVVTTPSKYLQNTFVAIRDDIEYIPNAIEISEYCNNLQVFPKPDLVWMHAFHQVYNPQLAIEVLRELINEYPDARLIMIGPDKGDGTLKEVKDMISTYHLSDRVRFVGSISKRQISLSMSQGNIFLNTTNYESFGVSVLEAAACGLCIVTTNVGELPNLWHEGVDALLVPPNDFSAMTMAIKRILTEQGLAQVLSRNARKKAENYDWSVVYPMWVKVLEHVVN